MKRESLTSKKPSFLSHPSYELLRKAITEDIAPLVLVTGSGLSRSAGYPDWNGLRVKLEILLKQKMAAELDADPRFSITEIEETLSTTDYWDFFKRAKSCLGRPTYNQHIINILSGHKHAKDNPLAELAKLNPKGVVTLNLDTITGDTISGFQDGSMLIPIYGFDIERKWRLINDEKRFLVYLHGHISDPTTWVLGKDELEALTKKPAHKLFLTNLYANNTVLFVGISAEDIAISEPLLSLQAAGIDANRVFWLTSRTDAKTRAWAETASVQIIPYNAANSDDHYQAVKRLVADVKSYSATDKSLIAPSTKDTRAFNATVSLISPDELANHDPEFVRRYLSDLVKEELDGLDEDAKYSRFIEIVNEYDYPIQTKSFYRSASPDKSLFFNYKLTFPYLGMGNFGTVYHGLDENMSNVAIKIMHGNIMNTPEMLGGFRRGARAMKILARRNVEGVAQVQETFEMPPTVVMQFVPGNSLQELFDSMPRIPWLKKVMIINETARIVDQCHKIHENVLHRDLKPSNIMIDGIDFDTFDYEKVTILDFDMSWHKGSHEKDVVFESRDDFGYLAPEQTDAKSVSLSRTTKVDCFGLGMTTLAMLRGIHPIPNMPFSPEFPRIVIQACKAGYVGKWRCLPYRLSRLILSSTAPDLDDRIDFSSFRVRINKIIDASIHSSGETQLDLFAEELLAGFAEGHSYDWNDIADTGYFSIAGGIGVRVTVDYSSLAVRIDLSYQDSGAKQYQRRNELIRQSRAALELECTKNNYKINRININHGMIESTVLIDRDFTVENVDAILRSLSKSLDILRQIN